MLLVLAACAPHQVGNRMRNICRRSWDILSIETNRPSYRETFTFVRAATLTPSILRALLILPLGILKYQTEAEADVHGIALISKSLMETFPACL